MTTTEKEYEYEFIRHDKGDEVLGRVWWDGKKIKADNPVLLVMLKSATIDGVSMDSGISYLVKLPKLFSNGYLSARRV